MSTLYTLRVYGIRINARGEILLSDERYGQTRFTKFPGGGMEAGEGSRDCLIREWREETGNNIEVGEHIYTTDYYQPSFKDPRVQVISIYYHVHPIDEEVFPVEDQVWNFRNTGDEEVLFRWRALETLHPDELTLPIDQLVARRLLHR